MTLFAKCSSSHSWNQRKVKRLSQVVSFLAKESTFIELANECAQILAAQPIVIKEIRPPVKIVGDLHGQYVDLMRFFDIWKAPTDTGDIHAYDYLFLGNYVDKGHYSLEVICLLMALKLKYPK